MRSLIIGLVVLCIVGGVKIGYAQQQDIQVTVTIPDVSALKALFGTPDDASFKARLQKELQIRADGVTRQLEVESWSRLLNLVDQEFMNPELSPTRRKALSDALKALLPPPPVFKPDPPTSETGVQPRTP